MANPATGNVVPLGEHPRARARSAPRESLPVLASCRELALERIARSFSAMLDRLEDDLFELAGKAGDRQAQDVYLDARSQARARRGAMEATFRAHFLDLFNRKADADSAAPVPAPELSLVAPEELEESLALQEMSRRVGSACEGELFALRQRMGFLLARPELAEDDNPLSPATVCQALRDACAQASEGSAVRMALLRQFQRYAEADLQPIYHELNARLVERRILPDIRPTPRRSAPAPRAPRADEAPAAPPDVFGTLMQLLGAAAVPAGAPGAPGAPGASGAACAAPSVPPEFLAELTRMHRDAAGGGVPVQALLKGIKAASAGAGLPALDAMTIDIVAMLFDYIFEDRHIPDAVKAQLGRLQIPTLKVALLDKTFFSSKSHPARRLVDLLAQAAIGLDAGNAADAPVLALIESAVQSVLAAFDTDLAPFEAQAARVLAFIEERDRAESDVVERSARLLEERERGQIAAAVAQDAVERRLGERPWTPVPLAGMLREAWAAVLARACREGGEGSPRWKALVDTMDELLWSVEPKAAPEDRRRLVSQLPGLLRRLQEGLRDAELDEARRDAFLAALVDCHASAVKSGLRGMAVLPPAPVVPPEEPDAEPAIARELVPAEGIHMEEIRLRPRARGPRNVFTRTGIWTNLERGTWVEFAADAGSARARLTWISPNKGMYLFTNPLTSAAAVSISPDALAEQMRRGEARLLDDAPLFERAVDRVLASLRNDAGAPAQG